MKISIALIGIIVAFLYLAFPLIIWVFFKKSKLGKFIVFISLILFLLVLFIGITCKINYEGTYAVVDFDFSGNWCDKSIKWSLSNIGLVDFIINIAMLIPIGLVIVYFGENSFFRTLLKLILVGILFGVLLESVQFILPIDRAVQLSDVLLNTLSVVIGGLIGILYDKIT